VTVIVRIVVPNIWSGILAAAFISVALVLGEFTIASLANYDTLQVVINRLGKSAATTSVAASLAVLVFATVLLLLLSFASRRQRGVKGIST
jgi:putative spermidine/putrescine transport system permease protein